MKELLLTLLHLSAFARGASFGEKYS